MGAEVPGRVLLTADTIGGVWTYAVELGVELARRGAAVTVATMGAPLSPSQRAQAAALPDSIVVRESAFRLEWMPDPWADVAHAGEWLLGLADELRPDVVHLNQFAFGALPFRAPTLLVAHSDVCSWWQAVQGEPAPAAWDHYRRVVRAGLAGADVVGAPTAAMVHALERAHGRHGRTVVLPNGRRARSARSRPKQSLIACAGRLWDEAKGLETLDAAAAGLPWPVRLAGPTSQPDGEQRAPRHAEALGELSEHDVQELMRNAAIYALPARYEPFGLSVLEAAMHGCALVLGDIASLRELWEGAALFVPPGNVPALHDALDRLCSDDAARRSLAAAAERRARRYTPARMADACLAAYRTAGWREPSVARREPRRVLEEGTCTS